MTIVYVNGKYTHRNHASIGAEDRASSFGDGVYEVALIKHGVMIDEVAHCKRLERSLAGLKIDAPMGWAALRQIIKRLLRVNGLSHVDATLYLQISRGQAKRDHAFPKDAIPSLFIMASRAAYPSSKLYETGGAAITAEDIRWLRRDIKSISLLPNVLAKQHSVEQKAHEAILIEADGTVTEGSSSNLFLVNKEKKLLTHPADNHILGGITRAGVIDVAKEHGIHVEEERFTHADLLQASELFLTSTTKHIFPITMLDGKKVGNGKVGEITRDLIKHYQKFVAKQWEKSCTQR